MDGERTKSCGSCGMCCKLPRIEVMGKPFGEWCQHAERGSGCGIYEERPQVCRSFRCLWLKQPEIPNELKPDKCGVLMIARAHARFGRTITCLVDRGNFDHVLRPKVRKFLIGTYSEGFKVFVSDGRISKQLLPTGELSTIPFTEGLTAMQPGG